MVKNLPDNASRRKRWGFDPWVRKTPWRRAQQPTPVFLPGEFHGKKSLTHRYNNVVFFFKVLASLFLNHLKLAQVSRNYHIINDEEILYNWKQMLSFFRNWWGVWRKKKRHLYGSRDLSNGPIPKWSEGLDAENQSLLVTFSWEFPLINEDSVSSNMSIENQHS